MSVLKLSANPNHAGKPKKTKKNPFKSFKWKLCFKKGFFFLSKLIKLLAKVIVGAILYVTLFHFVPELREYIPSLETFSIWILEIAEKLFSAIVEFLGC